MTQQVPASTAAGDAHLQDARVFFFGDKEWVRPLIVQELQLLLLLRCEAELWLLVTLAPCGDGKMAACHCSSRMHGWVMGMDIMQPLLQCQNS